MELLENEVIDVIHLDRDTLDQQSPTFPTSQTTSGPQTTGWQPLLWTIKAAPASVYWSDGVSDPELSA